MHAGQLDDRITIQRPVTVVDPIYGPQPGGWANVVERMPAEVRDDLPSSSERIEGGLRVADRPARVRIRYRPGLSSDMRVIVHRETDEIFEISGGPAMIGRREWVEFTIKAYTS